MKNLSHLSFSSFKHHFQITFPFSSRSRNFIKLQRANSTFGSAHLLSHSSRNLHASKAHRSASKIHRHPPPGIRIVKSKLISNAAAANTWRRGPVPRFPAPLSENFFPLFVSPLFSSVRLGSIEPLRPPRCE